MKAITIRELHARTGQWVRDVARHGQLLVTDHGRIVAKLVPETPPADIPYFARREPAPAFKRLDGSGRTGRGTDSSAAISQEREDRV
jgi:antitoxin (DNA-binding transcriptional repressor) of toxin-antitoxin stability system